MIEVQGAPLDSMIRMTASDLQACITAIHKAAIANQMSPTAASMVMAKLNQARRQCLGAVETLVKWDEIQKVYE